MKKAICLLAIGEKYQKILNRNKAQFLAYAQKCEADLVVIDEPLDSTFHRPILSQKLLIPERLIKYDEVAFLDIDILISENAPSIFDFLPPNKSFGAVLDPRGTKEFNETWKHIPRILTETTSDYFTERHFPAHEGLCGSINGGVFVCRPKEVATLFSDYYYSAHNQGVLNSFEETPMAYITQTRGIFAALPIEFNKQILYELKGTQAGQEIVRKEQKIPKIIRKFYHKLTKNTFFPTKDYSKFVKILLENNHFLHFAGGFPLRFIDASIPNISYGITVCNEAKELERLLNILVQRVGKKDEIIVLQDITNRNTEVDGVIEKYRNKISVVEARLNGDFATFKNQLIQKAKKDYLFQIDADEIPTESLLKNLKKFLVKHYKDDCFLVPRINTVEGITEAYIQKWNWNINEKGYINFPDYQYRIFKLNGKIRWKNKVHEVLVGYKKSAELPSENDDFCLLHPKTLDKQIHQNELYDKIEENI